ncbi:hypothetical protein [Streptomyces sp. NPDC058240]|uniref:hypothetical protein n=1 Tax=Streptomyces sp. NPDC058240 TaxID=3346396 RepID=UPI0036EBD50F
MTASSTTDAALKQARLARNMTLEEAADALNAITGGQSDANLMNTCGSRVGAVRASGTAWACASCAANGRKY